MLLSQVSVLSYPPEQTGLSATPRTERDVYLNEQGEEYQSSPRMNCAKAGRTINRLPALLSAQQTTNKIVYRR
jgi:hypothetical protein